MPRGAAVQFERQRVADFDAEPRFARAFGLSTGGKSTPSSLFAQRRRAVGMFGVQRLEAAGGQRRQRGDDQQAERRCAVVIQTTFTILCGTTMTLRTALPSSACFTASSAKTAASISGFWARARNRDLAALLAVDLDRQGHRVFDQQIALDFRPGGFGDQPWWPSACQHSSARCGIIGANS